MILFCSERSYIILLQYDITYCRMQHWRKVYSFDSSCDVGCTADLHELAKDQRDELDVIVKLQNQNWRINQKLLFWGKRGCEGWTKIIQQCHEFRITGSNSSRNPYSSAQTSCQEQSNWRSSACSRNVVVFGLRVERENWRRLGGILSCSRLGLKRACRPILVNLSYCRPIAFVPCKGTQGLG